MRARPGLIVASLAVAAAVAGCPEDEQCRVGTDCPSGICLSNGECGLSKPPDTGLVIAGNDAATEAPDAAEPAPPDASVAPRPDGGIAGCLPNGDGIITKAELPVVLGAHATFKVALDVPFDTAGTAQPDGGWLWDFSGTLAGDRDVVYSPKAIAGQWFATDFPEGEFTLRLASQDDTLGVYQAGTDVLSLWGMASEAHSVAATNFAYDVAVPVVAYPVKLSASWTGKGVIEGDYDGSSYHCDPTLLSCTPYPNCCIRHVYESVVDKAGKAKTPFATFEVLRIRNVVSFQMMAYGVWTTFKTVRSYVFVSECFGTVASIAAKDGETEDEFTEASEVRRLTP